MVFFELFAHNPTILRIPAGETLFTEGDEGRMMYVLATGTAEVIINNRVVETLQHGSIVGEIGIVLPGPRSATVWATGPSRLLELDAAAVEAFMAWQPQRGMKG